VVPVEHIGVELSGVRRRVERVDRRGTLFGLVAAEFGEHFLDGVAGHPIARTGRAHVLFQRVVDDDERLVAGLLEDDPAEFGVRVRPGVFALVEEALAIVVQQHAVLIAVNAVRSALVVGRFAVDECHVGAAPLAVRAGSRVEDHLDPSPVLYRLPRTFIAS